MLSSLTLNNTFFVVSLSYSSNKVTISRNHNNSNISLRSTSNHILDEIFVSRSINDGVVVVWSVKFLGLASNGNTTFSFFLLSIHIESKSERRFTKSFCFIL
mmetsp:Transcript_465/g.1328  ORF Transcript_465/g.1328 Transcript_465/m.1328 type:complete len:102 (-) Transcript_465:171-476(-)